MKVFHFQLDITGSYGGAVTASTREEALEAVLREWEKLNLDDIYSLLERPTQDDVVLWEEDQA